MLTSEQINVLGNLLETSFGRYSSSAGNVSIKLSLHGDTLILKYTTIVHFASETSLQLQVGRLAEESVSRLDDCLKELKKSYKEATGEALSVSDHGSRDNIEMISASNTTPRKVAYYRREHTLLIG